MVIIRKLVWDTRSIAHIARHYVVPEEVEEVCHKQPIVQRGMIRNRLVLLGPTFENRLLNVILENRGKGTYYPVTAYDASPEDKALYKRLRGGDEENGTNSRENKK